MTVWDPNPNHRERVMLVLAHIDTHTHTHAYHTYVHAHMLAYAYTCTYIPHIHTSHTYLTYIPHIHTLHTYACHTTDDDADDNDGMQEPETHHPLTTDNKNNNNNDIMDNNNNDMHNNSIHAVPAADAGVGTVTPTSAFRVTPLLTQRGSLTMQRYAQRASRFQDAGQRSGEPRQRSGEPHGLDAVDGAGAPDTAGVPAGVGIPLKDAEGDMWLNDEEEHMWSPMVTPSNPPAAAAAGQDTPMTVAAVVHNPDNTNGKDDTNRKEVTNQEATITPCKDTHAVDTPMLCVDDVETGCVPLSPRDTSDCPPTQPVGDDEEEDILPTQPMVSSPVVAAGRIGGAAGPTGGGGEGKSGGGYCGVRDDVPGTSSIPTSIPTSVPTSVPGSAPQQQQHSMSVAASAVALPGVGGEGEVLVAHRYRITPPTVVCVAAVGVLWLLLTY